MFARGAIIVSGTEGSFGTVTVTSFVIDTEGGGFFCGEAVGGTGGTIPGAGLTCMTATGFFKVGDDDDDEEAESAFGNILLRKS